MHYAFMGTLEDMDTATFQKKLKLGFVFSVVATVLYVAILAFVIIMVIVAPVFAALSAPGILMFCVFLLLCISLLWFMFRSLKKNYSKTKYRTVIFLALIPFFLLLWGVSL